METTVLTKEQALVKEIHSAFDHASDTLVAMASGGRISMEEKAERLKKLGFTKCREIEQLDLLKEEDSVYELALKYRKKYPGIKFITQKQLDRLCKKYSLVVGKPEKYIGGIPEQKLFEIEYWIDEIDPDDLPEIAFDYLLRIPDKDRERKIKEAISEYERKINGDEIDFLFASYPDVDNMYFSYSFHQSTGKTPQSESEIIKAFGKQGVSEEDFRRGELKVTKTDNSGLGIAAPKSMFKKEEVRHLDPIVLQPVKGGYLVLAKWGLEANDPELAIPELN
jgi:hypothetical protein